jgi:hypothetical protein
MGDKIIPCMANIKQKYRTFMNTKEIEELGLDPLMVTAGEWRKINVSWVPAILPDDAYASSFSSADPQNPSALIETIVIWNTDTFDPALIQLHTETELVVDKATTALKQKLLESQIKHGLIDGWRNPPTNVEAGDGRFFNTKEECLKAFHAHLAKGDTLDCIAYLVYLRELGHSGSLMPIKQETL